MGKSIYLLFKKIKEFNYKKLFYLLFKKIKEFKNKNEIALTFLIPYISILMIFFDEGWSDADNNLYVLIADQLVFAYKCTFFILLISFFIAFFTSLIWKNKNFWKVAFLVSIIQTFICFILFKNF